MATKQRRDAAWKAYERVLTHEESEGTTYPNPIKAAFIAGFVAAELIHRNDNRAEKRRLDRLERIAKQVGALAPKAT